MITSNFATTVGTISPQSVIEATIKDKWCRPSNRWLPRWCSPKISGPPIFEQMYNGIATILDNPKMKEPRVSKSYCLHFSHTAQSPHRPTVREFIDISSIHMLALTLGCALMNSSSKIKPILHTSCPLKSGMNQKRTLERVVERNSDVSDTYLLQCMLSMVLNT
jgi:hypothetical protein